MAFNLDSFRREVADGGARPSLFDMQIAWPNSVASGANLGPTSRFFVQASQIPAATIGTIQVPYQGRKLKYAGDRTYEDLTVTVMNDEGFRLRRAFEAWSNQIAGLGAQINGTLLGQPLLSGGFTTDFSLRQYARAGFVAREYTIKGAWPTSIGTITLNWGTVDEVETYEVTFAYQWFETTPATA